MSELIDQYDLFIIDQWGVLHDGQIGYHYAIDCIKNLSRLQKTLIIQKLFTNYACFKYILHSLGLYPKGKYVWPCS